MAQIRVFHLAAQKSGAIYCTLLLHSYILGLDMIVREESSNDLAHEDTDQNYSARLAT